MISDNGENPVEAWSREYIGQSAAGMETDAGCCANAVATNPASMVKIDIVRRMTGSLAQATRSAGYAPS